ncbi:MAG: ABC transporter permease, partial [Phototrophicales bacterium]
MAESPAQAGQARRRVRFQKLVPYLYIAPALIFIFIFVFYPLARTVQISFYEWNIVRDRQNYVGLDNYARLLSDPNFRQIIGQTFIYLLIAVVAVVA